MYNNYISNLIQSSIPQLSKTEEQEATTEQLIFSNIKFVVKLSNKYKAFAPQTDLISSGIVGLINAANKWDKTRGLKFITYAVHYIRMEMRNTINDNYTIKYSYQKGLKYEYIDNLKKVIDLGEKYKLKHTCNPIEKLIHIETISKIPEFLNKLSEIEKQVIENRFLNNTPTTLKVLSSQLGKTLVSTHLIEKRALQKLKKLIDDNI